MSDQQPFANLSTNMYESALQYIELEYPPVPVYYKTKKPIGKDWENAQIDKNNLSDHFRTVPINIGIKLGGSSRLADVDCDCQQAIVAAEALIPHTDQAFGRASKPLSHYIYRVTENIESQSFKDPADGGMIIELRSSAKGGTVGKQTVFPPSVHETGELIRFEPGRAGHPALVHGPDLLRAVKRTAAAALLARHWPARGSRHSCMLALAGLLCRAGWELREAQGFCRAVYVSVAAHDPKAVNRSDSEVEDTFRNLVAGEAVTGIPTLSECVGGNVVSKGLEWLEIGAQSGFGGFDGSPQANSRIIEERDWPEPAELQAELPPVEPFDPDLLPEALRGLAEDVAERMQVPLDLVAVPIVCSLAGAVNRRAHIQPKVKDTSWLVTPNLWGAVIAEPGYLKSPALQAIMKPLTRIQNNFSELYKAELLQYDVDFEDYEIQHAVWKETAKAAFKAGKQPPPRPDAAPPKPTRNRIIVNDSTFEALHLTMSENPAGILLFRDELTGWLSTLDKPGREGEREFALEAWNGDKGLTLDRIGRGTIDVPACCMSLLGGIQPSRLRSYLVDALHDGPANDGLIQRFQVICWPDMNKNWTLIDRPGDPTAENNVREIFRRLIELPVEPSLQMKFLPDAQELFYDFLKELETKVRGNELHPALVSHLSKYRSLMPSVAGLFQLADWAANICDSSVISLHHTKQAAAWCDYLESHAKRMYSCVTSPQVRAARELGSKLKTKRVAMDGDTFVMRSIYVKGWSGLHSPEDVRRACDVLEDMGWIRRLPGKSTPVGGRPSDKYQVNPRVLG